eukprot:gnl/Dysnectes_brevis/3211_a4013_1459.p1 GENE.gnl/Dysnectes_brevis/3211_a4013_1459~~gnl/Dysnectes_brevis/3211_a4013_1459.p1  ORF type:complete len:410 (+),score=33.08 gnl/Dysnectes_brevis/3211_a4013_1459:58-1230(+)
MASSDSTVVELTPDVLKSFKIVSLYNPLIPEQRAMETQMSYNQVEFHPFFSDLMAASVGDSVEFFDMGNGKRHPICEKQRFFPGVPITCIKWVATGPTSSQKYLLFSVDADFKRNNVYVYDYTLGKIVMTLEGHTDAVEGIATSNVVADSADTFVSVSRESMLAFSLSKQACIGKLQLPTFITEEKPLVLFSDHPSVFFLALGKRVFLCATSSWQPFTTLLLPTGWPSALQIAMSEDGVWIAVLTARGILIYNIAPNPVMKTRRLAAILQLPAAEPMPRGQQVPHLEWSPDCRFVLLSCWWANPRCPLAWDLRGLDQFYADRVLPAERMNTLDLCHLSPIELPFPSDADSDEARLILRFVPGTLVLVSGRGSQLEFLTVGLDSKPRRSYK